MKAHFEFYEIGDFAGVVFLQIPLADFLGRRAYSQIAAFRHYR